MSEKKEVGPELTFDAGGEAPKVKFQEIVRVEPCSYNSCKNGHRWPPQFQLAQCPGCGAPFVAVRMVNCPVCNEPTKSRKFRLDHTGQSFGIAALCRGQAGMAESSFIEMESTAAAEVETRWDETTGRMK